MLSENDVPCYRVILEADNTEDIMKREVIVITNGGGSTFVGGGSTSIGSGTTG